MDPFMVTAVTQLAYQEAWELPPRPPRRERMPRTRRAIARALRGIAWALKRVAQALEPRTAAGAPAPRPADAT
ncbi:hypothetical protein [Microbacterium karelineae]|uniref:hypothetical protein n=1 Tax=Microbacterium karelineae TaxID=2654283 RepID=UPI0012E9DBCA|nr:hypothetical protein [Microbacterium karelineae]